MYRILVLCFGLLLLCLYVTMGQYMGPISLGVRRAFESVLKWATKVARPFKGIHRKTQDRALPARGHRVGPRQAHKYWIFFVFRGFFFTIFWIFGGSGRLGSLISDTGHVLASRMVVQILDLASFRSRNLKIHIFLQFLVTRISALDTCDIDRCQLWTMSRLLTV